MSNINFVLKLDLLKSLNALKPRIITLVNVRSKQFSAASWNTKNQDLPGLHPLEPHRGVAHGPHQDKQVTTMQVIVANWKSELQYALVYVLHVGKSSTTKDLS